MRPATGKRHVDPAEGLRQAIFDAGLTIDREIKVDGRWHHFKSDGDKRPSGTYRHFGPFALFYHHRLEVQGTWPAKREIGSNEALRQKVSECLRITKERAREEGERAQRKAVATWRSATPISTHPYLVHKGVQSYGLRQHSDGRLLVPVTLGRQLWSLQFIDADGGKRFLPGGKVGGHYFSIGRPGKRIWLAEGYATAASIHLVTGDAVAVAFNAGNLPAVAGRILKWFSSSALYTAADHDDAGMKAADKTLSLGVRGWIAPPGKGDDWNDFHRAHGNQAAREALLSGVTNG